MAGGDEPLRVPKEEGFSFRDAGRTVAHAVGAVATTIWLVAIVGPLGLLALPLSAVLFWINLRREPVARERVPWMTQPPEGQWLEDAYASRMRGTDISTLAVRYDVDPDWLAAQLDAYRTSSS